MRKRLVSTAVVTVLAVLLVAGGVYAYDRSRADKIGNGVTISGIAVGGLTATEAEAKLRSTVLEPMQQPVKVVAGDKTYRLTPSRAKVTVDIDGSVAAALERSRAGNALSRTWRGLSGASLSESLALDISYSKKAVNRVVRRVQKDVDRPAVDASADLENGSFKPIEERDGIQVRSRKLRRDLRAQLLDTTSERTVKVGTRVLKPKVTTRQLAEKYPILIKVDRGAFTLELYKGLKLAKTYRVAIGAAGYDTPTGLYKITNKAVDPVWTKPDSDWIPEDERGEQVPPGPDNPLKARWLGIYDGVGVHGTDDAGSIGSAASHGCIRMLIPEVIELYDQVPVGAPIYIA